MRQFCLFVLALLLGLMLASAVSAQHARNPQPYYVPQQSQFQNQQQNPLQSQFQNQQQRQFSNQQQRQFSNQPQRQFSNQLKSQNAQYQPASSIVKRYTFSPQDLPQNTFSREPSFAETMPREDFTEDFAEVQRDDNRPYYSGTFVDPVPFRETVGSSFNDAYFSCRCYDEWTGFCTCAVGLSLDKDRSCGPRGCGANRNSGQRRGAPGSQFGGCGGGCR